MKSYLQRIQDIYKTVPSERLQAYMDRATAICGDTDKARQVLLNILSVSEALPDWWRKFSKKQKEHYLDIHPASKFKREAIVDAEIGPEAPPAAATPTPTIATPTPIPPEATPTTEATPTLDPEPEPEPEPEVNKSLKDLASEAWSEHRAKAASTLGRHKQGLHALRTLLTGGAVNKEDREKAKDTAILGTKLVLGALIGIVVFATAGPAAAFIAHKILTEGVSESSGISESSDKDAAEVLDQIHEWIMSQDLEQLAKDIEESDNAK